MGYTIDQLIDELMEMINADDGATSPGDQIMLNVAMRWTGIKGLSIAQPGLVMIDSED